MREILFICTGNYYRSRFAEAVFNHHAERAGAAVRAISRGLETFRIDPELHGDLSPLTRAALELRGIPRRHTAPAPVQLILDDLVRATRAIALDAREHRPMIEEAFPEHAGRVEFWDVPDVPGCPPAVALARIEANVLALFASAPARPVTA
jgi:protein-tyrosine phosphatase